MKTSSCLAVFFFLVTLTKASVPSSTTITSPFAGERHSTRPAATTFFAFNREYKMPRSTPCYLQKNGPLCTYCMPSFIGAASFLIILGALSLLNPQPTKCQYGIFLGSFMVGLCAGTRYALGKQRATQPRTVAPCK